METAALCSGRRCGKSCGPAIKPRHPYADAQYRVFKLDDVTFGIEVSLPDMLPTKITSFPSRAAANQWVEDHKKTVKKQTALVGQPQSAEG